MASTQFLMAEERVHAVDGRRCRFVHEQMASARRFNSAISGNVLREEVEWIDDGVVERAMKQHAFSASLGFLQHLSSRTADRRNIAAPTVFNHLIGPASDACSSSATSRPFKVGRTERTVARCCESGVLAPCALTGSKFLVSHHLACHAAGWRRSTTTTSARQEQSRAHERYDTVGVPSRTGLPTYF